MLIIPTLNSSLSRSRVIPVDGLWQTYSTRHAINKKHKLIDFLRLDAPPGPSYWEI